MATDFPRSLRITTTIVYSNAPSSGVDRAFHLQRDEALRRPIAGASNLRCPWQAGQTDELSRDRGLQWGQVRVAPLCRDAQVLMRRYRTRLSTRTLRPCPSRIRCGRGCANRRRRSRTGLQVAADHAALQQFDLLRGVDVAVQLAGQGQLVGGDATCRDLGALVDGEVALHLDVALNLPVMRTWPAPSILPSMVEVGGDDGLGPGFPPRADQGRAGAAAALR